MRRTSLGFTLVELLVVIAIIGILAATVTVALDSSQAKARDARRISDMRQIANAMRMYYLRTGNWAETGCGYLGGGAGWFSYQSAADNYPTSIAQCLINQGVTTHYFRDPSGGNTSNPGSGFAYMKYFTTSAVYLFAKLETVPQSSTATDATSCPTCDTSYGMNYYLQIDK